jgi:hypothetical protein
MADEKEAPGSSAQTAVAVGIGAAVGATILVPIVAAAAPILLPAAAAAWVIGSGTAVGAGLGAAAGWLGFGKK